jgi:hypothetical protein
MNREQQLTLLQTTQAHLEREKDEQKYIIGFDPFCDGTENATVQIGKITDTPEGKLIGYFIPVRQPQIDLYGFLNS